RPACQRPGFRSRFLPGKRSEVRCRLGPGRVSKAGVAFTLIGAVSSHRQRLLADRDLPRGRAIQQARKTVGLLSGERGKMLARSVATPAASLRIRAENSLASPLPAPEPLEQRQMGSPRRAESILAQTSGGPGSGVKCLLLSGMVFEGVTQEDLLPTIPVNVERVNTLPHPHHRAVIGNAERPC